MSRSFVVCGMHAASKDSVRCNGDESKGAPDEPFERFTHHDHRENARGWFVHEFRCGGDVERCVTPAKSRASSGRGRNGKKHEKEEQGDGG